MFGTIIKSNKGFFDVFLTEEKKRVVAKTRGILRHNNISPLVGDKVHLEMEGEAYIITELDERKNMLIRPNIANIDFGIIVISTKSPDFQHYLLDKYLAVLESNAIEPIIILTKMDLLSTEENAELTAIINYYQKIGYPVFTVFDHVLDKQSELEQLLSGKVASVIGQTGVGKTSFLNVLTDNEWALKTNEISKSLGRGKHTTRIVELYTIKDFWIADTPGFSSFVTHELKAKTLSHSFIEFRLFPCKFNDCVHENEIKCGVKKAVEDGEISSKRYENYLKFYHEIKDSEPAF